jgi:hypothetical protein
MVLWPSLDLAVSALFYTPGAGFTLKGAPWERALHESVPVLMVGVNLALIALWWFNRRTGRRLAGVRRAQAGVPALSVDSGAGTDRQSGASRSIGDGRGR